MRINELLVESQQLDEGPFTQAVGKVGGKIAKGIANVGKDLKTGFKAGYSGQQPAAAAPRDPDVAMNPKTGKPLTEPERAAHQAAGGQFDGETGDPLPLGTKATNPDYNPARKSAAAAPAKKAGGGFIDQFKQGFAQGRGEPTAKASATPAASTTAPAASTVAAPTADPAAEKAAKIGVGQINKIIPTLRTRDLMSLQANLEKTIASKKKAPVTPPAEQPVAAPAATPTNTASTAEPVVKGKKKAAPKVAKPSQAEIDADRARLMGANSESAVKKGHVVAESFSLYRRS
jgi:hypothetical protein